MLELILIVQITFFTLIFVTSYHILTLQGELLQAWARMINTSNLDEWIKKLILCPYCLGGQISLWLSFFFVFNKGADLIVFFSVPFSIVVIYFFIKHNFKD